MPALINISNFRVGKSRKKNFWMLQVASFLDDEKTEHKSSPNNFYDNQIMTHVTWFWGLCYLRILGLNKNIGYGNIVNECQPYCLNN